jgi:hypothetical protein
LAHLKLGDTLRLQGRFVESLAAYRRAHDLAPSNRIGITPRPSGSGKPNSWSNWMASWARSIRVSAGPRTARLGSGWPRSVGRRNIIEPRPACTPTPLPSSRNVRKTSRLSTATTLPAAPRSPRPAGARRPARWTTRNAPAGAGRRWTGCGPTWRPTPSGWRAARPRIGSWSGRGCAPGNATPTSPMCATPRPWPRCPATNRRPGRNCGRRSRRCFEGSGGS